MNNDVMQLVQNFMNQFAGQQCGGLTQWAIRQEETARLLQVAGEVRQSYSSKNPIISRRGERIQSGSYVTKVGEVGIMPIIGPLVSRQSDRYWSYDEIFHDAQMLAANPDINSVILDVNCPGGMVADIEVAALAISKLSSIKPTVAHINGIGASAAYWLAAATGEITATQSSIVGSVGSLISWLDIEGIFTKMGARKIEVLASQSPNKRLDPGSEEGRDELQAIVDDAGEAFLSSLSEYRGVDRDFILQNYGQGKVFPAKRALENGMVEKIISLEELITDMAARGSSNGNAASATAPVTQKDIKMNDKTKGGQAAKILTIDIMRTDHADLVSQIESEAVGGATPDIATAAATAERDRILGIEAVALPGHDDLIASMKADGKTTKGDAAINITAAEKEAAKNRLEGLSQLDAAAAGVVSTPSSDGGSALTKASTPDEWKAEWQASEEMQVQHLTADAYVAVMKRQNK